MRFFRALAFFYSTLLALAILSAALVDFTLRNDPSEHMLPNFILFIFCAPLDLMLFLLPPKFMIAMGFWQLVAVAACGILQGALLLWFTRSHERPGSSGSNLRWSGP